MMSPGFSTSADLAGKPATPAFESGRKCTSCVPPRDTNRIVSPCSATTSLGAKYVRPCSSRTISTVMTLALNSKARIAACIQSSLRRRRSRAHGARVGLEQSAGCFHGGGAVSRGDRVDEIVVERRRVLLRDRIAQHVRDRVAEDGRE